MAYNNNNFPIYPTEMSPYHPSGHHAQPWNHMPSTFGPMTPFNESYGFPTTSMMPFGGFPTFGGFHNINAEMNKMNHWMNRMMKDVNRHMLPREIRDVAFRPQNMLEYTTLVNPVEYHPIDGSRSLHLCFDVRGFKPEEINVSVEPKDRCVTVMAKHETKDVKDHAVTRSYMRKYNIPEEYHVDLTKTELKSCLTPDGLLVIEGALPRITPEELKALKTPTMGSKVGYPAAVNTTTGGIVGSGFNAVSIPIKMC